jgi:peptidoglycan-N-acetylglucosamine deacetylase
MRRHVPSIIALALACVIAMAAVVFAYVAPLPRPAPMRQRVDASQTVTPDESTVSVAFSVSDTQANLINPSITPPQRVFDHPQRMPGTAKRLASVNRTFDPAPPDYLLAQGITRIRDAGKRVVLTFDDGPSKNTTAVLEILTRYKAHATFFMVGRRIEPWRYLARAVLAQGSELGNHTMDHVGLLKHTEQWDEQEILEAENVFFTSCGVRPVYVRTKGGGVDDTGMAAIKALHKEYVYWDVAGFDTVPEFMPADIRDNVLEDARPGSVILLHETNPRTVEALPGILQGLQRKGYKVESLTEVLAH